MYKVVGVSRKIDSDKNVYCKSVCKIAHWAEFENRPFALSGLNWQMVCAWFSRLLLSEIIPTLLYIGDTYTSGSACMWSVVVRVGSGRENRWAWASWQVILVNKRPSSRVWTGAGWRAYKPSSSAVSGSTLEALKVVSGPVVPNRPLGGPSPDRQISHGGVVSTHFLHLGNLFFSVQHVLLIWCILYFRRFPTILLS